MNKYFLIVAATVLSGFAGAAQARDIQDGKLQVKPAKEGKYIVDNAKLGKAELYGYVADYIETKKITGIVLRDGSNATDDQKHIIAITAKAQNIDAFVELGGKEIALVDPVPAAPATPPPVDNVTPVTTPAVPTTPASPATPAASTTPTSH